MAVASRAVGDGGFVFDRLNNLARGRSGDARVFSGRRLGSLGFLAALALLVLAVMVRVPAGQPDARAERVALLVPDRADFSEALIAIWRHAAGEEGIALDVVTDSTFLRPRFGPGRDYAGVILPDSVHPAASSVLLERLENFVRSGGWLFPVFDAATHTERGAWYPVAPLSTLVGVEYARYADLRDGTLRSGHLVGTPEALREIEVPPGKSMPELPGGLRAISGYHYGQLTYPSFVTRGAFTGRTLLTSAGGLGAGWRALGRGGVLFVNTPLGYLAGQTDGLLLHCFLRYFAMRLLALPTLSPTPGGVGGLIFNVHLDANGAMEPLKQLAAQGLLEQGPFSIHITAGPDTYRFGDRAGLDLGHNAELLEWIGLLVRRGDAIGSHGGWIHNYFAEHVTEDNQAEMQQFLELNAAAIEAASGQPCLEYSAPAGNQPRWVTRWLEKHGFLAYYFTGNSGMAPTRTYRDGRLETPRIWSFPISVLGEMAAFEEAEASGLGQDEVAAWLVQLSDFASETGTVRTFYSHPPGWVAYTEAIRTWFAHTKELSAAGRFSFYTMTRIAQFLDRREEATWQARDKAGELWVEASHPSSLAELTWVLPRVRFDRPRIERGSATVKETPIAWYVTASEGRELSFAVRRVGLAVRGWPRG